MARYKGHQGDVEIGGTSVGERISFDIEMSVAEADASTMGNDWTDTDGLQKSASGTLEVFYDHGDAQQQQLVEGATVTATFYPTGNTTGMDSISGDWLIVSRSAAVSVGDLVKRTYSIKNKLTIAVTSVA